ncbi:choice-of-anchor Q domain-containing protein [Spirosoma areae]
MDTGTKALGVSDFDLDNKARVKGRKIDMGAYEFQ